MDKPHPMAKVLLFVCMAAISGLLISLISTSSLVLRHTHNLGNVVEHNGVLSFLRVQAFYCLIPAFLGALALKFGNSNRLAIVCLAASLVCGCGYLLLEQAIRNILGWH